MTDNAWRRLAVRPKTGKQLDILLALTNVSRAENARLKLYELLGQLVSSKWNEAKSRGLVTDAMLAEEELDGEPTYEDVLAEGGIPSL